MVRSVFGGAFSAAVSSSSCRGSASSATSLAAAASGAFCPIKTERCLDDIIDSVSEVRKNTIAAPLVTRVRKLPAPRPPKICPLAPPKAAPMPPPRPDCSSTTRMRNKDAKMWMHLSSVSMKIALSSAPAALSLPRGVPVLEFDCSSSLNLAPVVRQGRLELPRYFYRQPLKLVRLPIPPLPPLLVQDTVVAHLARRAGPCQ